MQQARGIDEKYRTGAQEVAVHRESKVRASGQRPSLVAVFALRPILPFVVVSVAEAPTTLGAGRWARGRRSRLADEDQFVSVPCNRTEDAADVDLENWPELVLIPHLADELAELPEQVRAPRLGWSLYGHMAVAISPSSRVSLSPSHR